MVALDKAIDDGAKLRGAAKDADYQAPSLSSSIYWENPQSYSTPGAPPNGSDYVRLRDAAGNRPRREGHPLDRVLGSGEARRGADGVAVGVCRRAMPSSPPVPPTTSTARSCARSPSRRAANRTLTFDTKYETETGWDFAFVQVSTDDGLTWTSLANTGTTSEHDPSAALADRRAAAGPQRRRRLACRVVRPRGRTRARRC